MSEPRRWTLWASAGFVAFVVVVGLTAVVTSWLVGDEPEPEFQGRTPAPSGVAHSAGADCPSDTDQTPPDQAPPEGVSWRPLSDDVRMMLPFSDRYGPCEITDTTASGYAHTPRGALLAAAQIATRVSVPGEIGRDTIEQQVVPGPWRDAMLAELDGDAPSSDAAAVTIAAFAVSFSGGDAARVALAVTHPSDPGVYWVFQVDMAWLDGDWRMQAPLGGDWNNVVTTQTTLPDGFVAWGAE